VRNAAPHQLFHVLVVPNTASNGDPVSHPRHVHIKMLASHGLLIVAASSAVLVAMSAGTLRLSMKNDEAG
jgi:hypothetical protein